MLFDAFTGPSNTAQSVNVDAERSVNLYAETVDAGAPKARKVLYGTPGIHAFGLLPVGPVRGLWVGEGRLFAVAGPNLYEVFADGTYNNRGSVGADSANSPIQIFPNGTQLMIVSANVVYCDNGSGPVAVNFSTAYSGMVNVSGGLVAWVSGDTFSQNFVGQTMLLVSIGGTSNATVISVSPNGLTALLLAAPAFSGSAGYSVNIGVTASRGAFLDGYGIAAVPNSRQINISAINNFTSWNTLDFAIKEGYPDALVSLLADHEELWLFGSQTTEVWQDTGAASFPLQRIPGAFIHKGCVAANSPTRLAGGVAWLSGDSQGRTIAVRAQGFSPQRVSTHAVETAWAAFSSVSDAWSYTYVDRGHEFWIINFPTANQTWAYDATEGLWHERAFLNGSNLERERGCCHAFVFGKHLVGDRATGQIWELNSGFYDDNGGDRMYIRTAPHLSTEQLWAFYSRFQLDLEVGQSSSVPAVKLSWSDDGGHTFGLARTQTPSNATYSARLQFKRLGKSRDRVFSVSIQGQTKIALIRAILDVEQGDS